MDDGLDAGLDLDQNEQALQAALTDEPVDEADSPATFKSTFQFTKAYVDTETLHLLSETGHFESELNPIEKSRTLFAQALDSTDLEDNVFYIARKQTAVGFFRDAKNALATLNDPDAYKKTTALMDIARAQCRAGSRNDAKATLKEASLFALAPESSFPDDPDLEDESSCDHYFMRQRIVSIYQVAVLQSELGFTEDAAISLLNGNELRETEYIERDFNENGNPDTDEWMHKWIYHSNPAWYSKLGIASHNMGFTKTAEVYLKKAAHSAGELHVSMNYYDESWWFCPSVMLTELAQEQLSHGYRDSAISILRTAEELAEVPILYFNDKDLVSLKSYRVLAEKQAEFGFPDDATRNFQKAKAALHVELTEEWDGDDDEIPSPLTKAEALIKIAISEEKSGFPDNAEATLNSARTMLPYNYYLDLWTQECKNESRELMDRGLHQEALALENKNISVVGPSYPSFDLNILRARFESDNEIRKGIFNNVLSEVLGEGQTEQVVVNTEAQENEIVVKFKQLARIASAQADTFLPDDALATINLMKDFRQRIRVSYDAEQINLEIDVSLARAHADLAASLMERFRR